VLIDSHCHLDRLRLNKYDGQLDRAVNAAQEAGVEAILCVGISLENRAEVVALSEQYPMVVSSVGVHPLDIDGGLASAEDLQTWSQHEKVVALGETGLDYYYSEESKQTQQNSFATHLQAAAVVGLPVIVHTRDAKEDTLSLIKNHGSENSAGVLHCFTEDWDMAKRAIDLNYLISISGIVTFRNAEALRDVVKKLPLDRLMVETDSPYLAPVPKRGKPNEPAFVRHVAEYVAGLKNISYEELLEQTANNFFKLFSKAKPFFPQYQHHNTKD